MSVNDMWIKIKTGFLETVERFIPTKNDQNKVQSAMDRCYDQTAYEKTRARKSNGPRREKSCLRGL